MYTGVISGNFYAFFRNMTKHDGYFHLLMTATVLGGFLFMSTAGESVWRTANKGVNASAVVGLTALQLLVFIWQLHRSCR